MKKFIFSLSICALFLFTSCGSDDDGVVVTEALVAGAWDLEALDYTGSTSTSTLGQSVTTSSFTGKAINIDFMVTFNESPQTSSSSGEYDIELTSTVAGQTTTTTEPAADDFAFNGTWTLDGNRLTVQNQTTSAEYEVVEVSDNRMVLYLDTEVTEDVFGISVTAKIQGDVVLVK